MARAGLSSHVAQLGAKRVTARATGRVAVLRRLGPTGLAVVAGMFVLACTKPSGEVAENANATSTDPANGESSAVAMHDGTQWLEQAHMTLADGALPDKLRSELESSDDPNLARARRLFAAFDQARAEAEVDGQGPSVDAPRVNDALDSVVDAAKVRPVTGSADEAGQPSSASPESSAGLTVITAVELEREGSAVALVLRGTRGDAGADVGVLHQAESDIVRVVARSAAALPNVLRARPSLGAVKVEDVQRGDGTVIFTVRLQDGWRAGTPEPGRTSTRLAFSPG